MLFDQSPIVMVFRDRQLRARRNNAALRRLNGLPDKALLGCRPSETDLDVDTALMERTLARQVLGRGVPVIDVHRVGRQPYYSSAIANCHLGYALMAPAGAVAHGRSSGHLRRPG